ncbi:hypothetical protein Tco_1103036 [Tanacetum coccineum]
MMTRTKFDIKKFNGKNEFWLWQVRMKALLEQQGLVAALEELLAATIVLWEITKETTGGLQRGFEKSKIQSEHIDEFHMLVGDLAAIDTVILDEDQALLLLTTLSSSYNNFVVTLLYGRDTLKLEDVLATLNYRKLQNMTEAKGDGGEGLYVRGRFGQRDMKYGTYSQPEEHLKRDCPSNHKKSQGFVKNKDRVSSFGDDEYDNADAYDGGNVLLGDDRECRIRGTSKVHVQMRDGLSFVLHNVRCVLELRQNLISLGTLKKEGFSVKMQSGKIKEMTIKTLKGRKQLGEYQTGWKIKTSNVLNSCNQGSTQYCMKSGEDHAFEVEPQGNVDHIAGSQEVQTQDLIDYHSARDKEQHSARELFRKSSDDNDGYYWEYTPAAYMTLTKAAKEVIWLKGLTIETRFELKTVASIATGALSKAIPGLRFRYRMNLLSISID